MAVNFGYSGGGYSGGDYQQNQSAYQPKTFQGLEANESMFERQQKFEQDIQEQKQNYQKRLQQGEHLFNPQALSGNKLYLSVSGEIESGIFSEDANLKISFEIKAPDQYWQLMEGPSKQEEAQIRGNSQFCTSSSLKGNELAWNLPFEGLFQSENPSQWPRLEIEVKGFKSNGLPYNGQGSIYIPTTAGDYQKTIYVYQIQEKEMWKIFKMNVKPNTMLSENERETIRVDSIGKIKINFHVLLRNLHMLQYLP